MTEKKPIKPVVTISSGLSRLCANGEHDRCKDSNCKCACHKARWAKP